MKTNRYLFVFAVIMACSIRCFGQTDGQQKWSHTIGSAVDGSLRHRAEGTVYITAQDGVLYALNPATGNSSWSVDLHNTGGEFLSSPAVNSSGVIYATSMDGNLYARQFRRQRSMDEQHRYAVRAGRRGRFSGNRQCRRDLHNG